VLARTYDDQTCSIARALEVVGERWTLLLLRDVMLGLRRFDELRESLGVTRTVLSRRLAWMVDEGLLERRRYSERPERFEYWPTDKATELWPVLAHLLMWGDRHYPEPEGPPRLLEHAGCGGRVDRRLRCERCGRELEGEDVVMRDGPALTATRG